MAIKDAKDLGDVSDLCEAIVKSFLQWLCVASVCDEGRQAMVSVDARLDELLSSIPTKETAGSLVSDANMDRLLISLATESDTQLTYTSS